MISSAIKGFIVDILNREIYPGRVNIEGRRIRSIDRLTDREVPHQYILPGFIDAHIHIESSMLVPSEFAQIAVQHGTVATVSDPHEIANVCGVEGVRYMIRNAAQVPLKFCFGAPSCVPATPFETAGAVIDAAAVEALLRDDHIYYLAEMMNFPGVLNEDPEVMRKIAAARACNKPVDGHAPGLRGELADRYIRAGISTDHECTSLEEALHKIAGGMKILIREGSAAKNYQALHPLFNTHPEWLMLCSDDKHPDELLHGHINTLVARALRDGHDLFHVLYAACIHPVIHYKLPVGYLREGDYADFIVVDSFERLNVLRTYINGEKVFTNGKVFFERVPVPRINNFKCHTISETDLALTYEGGGDAPVEVKVIEAVDGEIITGEGTAMLRPVKGRLCSDVRQDVLKIVIVNRYRDARPAVGFIRNFRLKQGAIASSVAHDSHNIVAIGVSDQAIAAVVNTIIRNEGGIAVHDGRETHILPLPVAGLMSDKDITEVAGHYELLDAKAKALGCTLKAPFMTLSFMALPVIPRLKMTDKGLFDVGIFDFVSTVNV